MSCQIPFVELKVFASHYHRWCSEWSGEECSDVGTFAGEISLMKEEKRGKPILNKRVNEEVSAFFSVKTSHFFPCIIVNPKQSTIKQDKQTVRVIIIKPNVVFVFCC